MDGTLDDRVDMSFSPDMLDHSQFQDPSFSPGAMTVLQMRILRKDDQGDQETPKEALLRIATDIANGDLLYDPGRTRQDHIDTVREFYDLMARKEFFPNSPTWTGAGVPELQMLSACFVLPVEDDMDSIFDGIKYTAKVHKKGGGTGFNFGNLRRRGDIVGTTNGVSSGPISFMRAYDAATETVKQGGTRRGANMGILPYDHPDIYEFIHCKKKDGEFSNFNISVAVDEEFMGRVNIDGYFKLMNPHGDKRHIVKGTELFSIDDSIYTNPKRLEEAPTLARSRDGKSVIFSRTGEEVGKIENDVVYLSAKRLWEDITYNAWNQADPGVIFMDRINQDNPTPHVGNIQSTNPCGEQPLLPFESCNLGSINLGVMVDEENHIDYERLRRVVKSGVHFLDNVIDRNKYPIPQIEEMSKANRKIGLGIMGLHDMLIKLGIPYDSEEGREAASEVMKFIQDESKLASIELGKARGAFPNFKGSIYDTRDDAPPMRNATTTTIAPTGTLSMLADASSGCEPLFSIIYEKTCLDETKFDMTPLSFRKILLEMYKDDPKKADKVQDIRQRIIADDGRIGGIDEIPDDVKRVYRSAMEIDPLDHVKMQGALQRFVDNAVSKTINLPRESTIEDIRTIFEASYANGCKGTTIYRYGSKDSQILTAGQKAPEERTFKDLLYLVAERFADEPPMNPSIKMKPAIAYNIPITKSTGRQGTLHASVTMDPNGYINQVFLSTTSPGQEDSINVQVDGINISRRLGLGDNLQDIIDDYIHVRSQNTYGYGPNKVHSVKNAVGQLVVAHCMQTGLLKKNGGGLLEQIVFKSDVQKEEKPDLLANPGIDYGACPECGVSYTRPPEGGCETPTCDFCGYNQCG